LPQSTVSEIASWLVGHTLDEVERELIRHTLENCGGDRVLAATVLGLSRPALRRKLTAYAVRGQALPGEPEPAPAPEPKLIQAAPESRAVESRAVAPVPQADNDHAPKPAAVVPRPEKLKSADFRLLAGGAFAAALIVLIGAGLIGESKPGAGFAPPERARIELSVIERPQPFQHRITVPVWNGPQPLSAEPAVPFASEADTRMALAASSEPDVRMALAADSEIDTRMELAADTELDTRMELAGVSEDAAIVAPDEVPEPLVRPAPAAAKTARVQRRAAPPRAAPAQAETPAPAVPLLFPFNIFAPRTAQRTAGGGAPVPYDCCANN
jgi:hypothetical protein